MPHLVLVKKEASGLTGRIDHEGEPVAEPLQHDGILEAQVVGRQSHSLQRKTASNTAEHSSRLRNPGFARCVHTSK